MVRGLATKLELHGLYFVNGGNLELFKNLIAVLIRSRTEIDDLPLDGMAKGRRVGEGDLQIDGIFEITLVIFYPDIIYRYL